MSLILIIFLSILLVIIVFVVSYYLIAMLLMRYFPTKPKPIPSNSEIFYEIWILSNGVHTDFYLPWNNPEIDWASFIDLDLFQPTNPRYISFGWGDRGFYLETPSWAELKPKVALKALFKLGTTVVQVALHQELPLKESQYIAKLQVTPEQYHRIIAHIKQGFDVDSTQKPQPVAFTGLPAYEHLNYHFFEGNGQYHFFQTCNNWVNQGLKAAKIPSARWAPFAKSVFHHLSDIKIAKK